MFTENGVKLKPDIKRIIRFLSKVPT